MTQAFHRSFSRDFRRPLGEFGESQTAAAVRSLGNVRDHDQTYPLYLVQLPGSPVPGRPSILISGGVHGDEPAGAYAAMDFLVRHADRYADQFNFYVLPCLNPGGYEAATLESLGGVNLNRQFGLGSGQPAVTLIEQWLERERPSFRATFDLHEAPPYYVGEGFTEEDNPRGCFLYETVTDDSPRIGRQLIDSLPADTEVCRWPRIYLDRNNDGVISYPEDGQNPVYQEGTTFDAWLNGRFTGHSLTTETPTCWPVDKRVQTQLHWIMQALTQFSV